MPNTAWSKLNHLQIGRYAEYLAKMELASYGFDIYTSEVDDHGIDFVAKNNNSQFYEFQVKALRLEKTNYVFMKEINWNICNSQLYLVLLLFEDGKMPNVFLIPATAWKCPNSLLCYRTYDGKKSAPEYGINLSKKNMELLDIYRFEKIVCQLSNDFE